MIWMINVGEKDKRIKEIEEKNRRAREI